mgnify:CR=1 FL=1
MITLTALALPGIRSLEIGRSALCRLSFEPLCASGTLWFATVISSIPVDLIHATMEGRLSREWLQAGFTDGAAHMMTLLINVMFWIIIYGILYWGITCIRAVLLWDCGAILRNAPGLDDFALLQALDSEGSGSLFQYRLGRKVHADHWKGCDCQFYYSGSHFLPVVLGDWASVIYSLVLFSF